MNSSIYNNIVIYCTILNEKTNLRPGDKDGQNLREGSLSILHQLFIVNKNQILK